MDLGQKFIAFFSHHFEEVVYIYAGFFSLFLGIYILNLLKRRPVEVQVRSYLDTALGTTLLFLLVFGTSLSAAIYWANYKSPFIDFELHENISRNTTWVKEDLRLYVVNENELLSLSINGEDEQIIFTEENPIRDFQFSPDGKHILIATYKKLYAYDMKNNNYWLVDGIDKSDNDESLKGTISSIRWSPDGQLFTYQLSRWSNFGTQDNVYVYDINQRNKQSIKNTKRAISSLYWNDKGDSLYFLKYDSSELDEREIIYKIKVFRIGLDDLKVQFVTDILTDEAKFPTVHLEMLGINLYIPDKGLSYGRVGEYASLLSSKGDEIGIDDYNYFYYKHRWFKKRLFKVKREVDSSKTPTFLNTYGEHVLQQIRWTPSGQYVIMDHPYWGILILDPKKRKVGQIYPYEVSAFGWYSGK